MTVVDGTSPLREAHGAYVETRGWAQGAWTLQLRWRLRRLPAHSIDQAARRKALTDELRDRGKAAR